jgi:adenine C2-methylase RlmN of 23S rRNA A2503 and tRNA A37
MNKLILNHVGTFKDFDDGTIKFVYQNKKGFIETTLIENKSNFSADVYCVPTHHYCNLGCKMCHLTKEGYKKPMQGLDSDSLISSIIQTYTFGKKKGRTFNENGLISFMGAGEPLLNLKLIKESYEKEKFLKEKTNYKEITYALATMMPNKNLENLTKYANNNNFPLKIHFSMHSPFTKERLNLLPGTKLSVEESLTLLSNYRENIKDNKKITNNLSRYHISEDPIEIHYTLIKNHNDSNKHLDKTIMLLDKFRIPFKMLTFNPVGKLKRSKKENFWLKELQSNFPNLPISIYNPPGHKIGSSCGEFTKHYYLSELETKKEKKEFEDWKHKHQIFN